jgi:hypothetical protein
MKKPYYKLLYLQVRVFGGNVTDRVYVDISSANGTIWIEGGNDQNIVTLKGTAPLDVYKRVLLTTKSAKINNSA